MRLSRFDRGTVGCSSREGAVRSHGTPAPRSQRLYHPRRVLSRRFGNRLRGGASSRTGAVSARRAGRGSTSRWVRLNRRTAKETESFASRRAVWFELGNAHRRAVLNCVPRKLGGPALVGRVRRWSVASGLSHRHMGAGSRDHQSRGAEEGAVPSVSRPPVPCQVTCRPVNFGFDPCR